MVYSKFFIVKGQNIIKLFIYYIFRILNKLIIYAVDGASALTK